ncbi:TetR/AcrR family transcriptional regulator [Kutzneria kofuensis]|uniref:AcrR family transcriptional regulator n=1 Tax=Kutzneria kofuensis TaxID=103725 RepID=A0A7W9KRP3_9PSEU|nr:TetR/AcrR family transcriptional regulator [Kutzneria kofuensis]MBB5897400.1 AcrR family transcriptional regulator [Kutzneria kofuensis]
MPRPSVEAERKAQILSATCAVIAESGIHDLRLTDVATRAGVSSGTIHYYFDSKQALLHAAFEYNFRHSLERRAAVLAADGNPLELLTRLVESYAPLDAESVSAWRVWAELWVHGLREPELQELNESIYGDWRRTVIGLLRDAQDQGLIGDGDPVLLANTVVAMIDGLAIQVLLGSRNMTVDRMRATCRAYLSGLAG